MKENSVEEDIINAQHFINSIKTDKDYKDENGWHGYYNREIVELVRILDHILSDYKRVLKENKELKKFITEGITIEPNSPYKNYQLDFLRKNFIPVQKVKDKIEEEKLPLVIVGGRRNKKTLEYGIKLGRRYVLQELLERRK